VTLAQRPRRSALYVPGNNARALQKAQALPADVVIFDLEDAVGCEAKTESRERVCRAIDDGGYQPREVVVRVNGIGTEWHDDDLAAVAHTGADAVLVPKVESAQQVQDLTATLQQFDAPSGLQLWVMIETPRAFFRVEEIAAASDRLTVLVIGSNDLVNDLHALHVAGRTPIVPALAIAVLGARSAGKAILDGVFNAIADESGFADEVRQGRVMGFDGKTLVHPSQLAMANATFGPSPAELADAHAVISAYERSQASGESVIVVDGRMIEALHVRDALRIVALDEQIADLERRFA
jgi:citrate lyase subunit beta/citryl-CoA lyase